MSINTITRMSMLAVTSVLCAACASTEVRDLAKTTATNTSLVSTQLAAFAKNTRRIAERRADAAASLGEEVERQQATFDAYLEGARAAAVIAGQAKKPNYSLMVVELQRVSDAIQARRQAALLERAAIRQAILSSQSAFTIPKQSLATISKNLGALAEEPSRKDQLEFLTKFFAQVVKDIKDAKKASDEAINDADSRAESMNDAMSEPGT